MKISFFIGGIFFLSEIIILWICYKFIYKKKNTSSMSFCDLIRMFINYYLFMLRYRFKASMRNCQMDEFLQRYSELRFLIYEKIILGIGGIIILPVILIFVSWHFPFSEIPILVYIAGVSVFLEELKASRITWMSLLNESQKFLFKFGRQKKYMGKGETAEREKHRVSEKRQKGQRGILKIVIVCLTVACADIAMVLVMGDMLDIGGKILSGTFRFKDTVFVSPFFIVMVFTTFLLFLIFRLLDREFRNNIKQKRRYKKQLKARDEVNVWFTNENQEELNGWLDEILDMCCILQIKEVSVRIDDLNVKKVVSVIFETQMPAIIIGRDVFNKSRKYAPWIHFSIINLLFAHELVHIYYNDTKWMRKVAGIALLYIAFSVAMIFYAANSQDAAAMGIAAILSLNFFVFGKMSDERYWKQVMEFRADRIGMALSNTTPAILKEALRCTAEGETDDGKDDSTGIFHRIYQKQVEQQVHPDIRRRIEEAERGKPWGITEYFRYLWLISWNVFTRRGWKI